MILLRKCNKCIQISPTVDVILVGKKGNSCMDLVSECIILIDSSIQSNQLKEHLVSNKISLQYFLHQISRNLDCCPSVVCHTEFIDQSLMLS